MLFTVQKKSSTSSRSSHLFLRRISLALLPFLAFATTAFAQTLDGRSPENTGKRPPAIGVIAGRVADANTKQPIEFATVSLVRLRDSTVVSGGVTDNNGVFTLTELPFGKFKLKVNFIGYKNQEYPSPISLKPDAARAETGIIFLTPSAVNLTEATVTGAKAQFVNSIDKKVFTVGKDIISTGASVSDLLANVPSVSVDIDGGIALRGSTNVTILIDGKPSALLGTNKADILRQLPASSIESIELITNPSAKYDPEGVSGIINIVLKKNKQKGFNGQVQFGVGNNSTLTGINKYNGSASFNYRTPTYNLFANYGYRNDERDGYGNFDRQVYIPNISRPTGTPIYNVSEGFQNFASNSNTVNANNNFGHNARLGVDFYLNKTNTLGIAGGFNAGERVQNEVTKFREDTVFNDFTKQTARYNERGIINQSKNISYDGNLNFKHQFALPKQELTADISYSASNNNGIGTYTPDTTIKQFRVVNHLLGQERQNTVSSNYVLTAQTDYTQPLKDGARVEAGYRYTNRALDNDLQFLDSRGALDNLVLNTGRTNRFLYAEQIHAAYSTYTNTVNFLPNWAIKLGFAPSKPK